ncbi:hypothetical protein CsatA_015943 [Cannabis sativa]
MAKHSVGWVASQKWWLLAFLVMLSVSTLIAFFIRAAFDTCDRNLDAVDKRPSTVPYSDFIVGASPNPLKLMKSKLVLLVSHELSLSGGPLLLMELAFLLRSGGAPVELHGWLERR